MRGPLTHWLILGLLLGTAIYAIAEEITLTTYYPSPRGVYQELRVGAGGPFEAPFGALHILKPTDDGNVAFRVDDEVPGSGTDTTPFVIDQAGNVGIGTVSPTQKLDVDGQARIRGGGPNAGEVLTATDSTGVASWEPAVLPSQAVMFFNLSTCPAGWSPFPGLDGGRYVVGVPPGAGYTIGSTATQGTALTDLEDRQVAQHTHTTDFPIINDHREVWWCGGAGGGYPNYTDLQACGAPRWWGGVSPGDPGVITIGQAGSVADTPAPYIQLLVCQKN